jgi:hypothetical protein
MQSQKFQVLRYGRKVAAVLIAVLGLASPTAMGADVGVSLECFYGANAPDSGFWVVIDYASSNVTYGVFETGLKSEAVGTRQANISDNEVDWREYYQAGRVSGTQYRLFRLDRYGGKLLIEQTGMDHLMIATCKIAQPRARQF